MFLVVVLKEEIEVEILGIKQTTNLCFSDGMIGALPVFDKYEDAVRYAGDENLVQEIFEKKPKTESNQIMH